MMNQPTEQRVLQPVLQHGEDQEAHDRFQDIFHEDDAPIFIKGDMVEHVSSLRILEIFKDLSWTTNTTALLKKAQRMFLLRMLKKAAPPPPNPVLLTC